MSTDRGRAAYEAYCRALDGRTERIVGDQLQIGLLLRWDYLPQRERDAWSAAAVARPPAAKPVMPPNEVIPDPLDYLCKWLKGHLRGERT